MQTVVKKIDPEPRHVKVRPPWFSTIPGDLALLCLDCQAIWDIRAGACSCGSKAALHILKTLDREGVQVGR